MHQLPKSKELLSYRQYEFRFRHFTYWYSSHIPGRLHSTSTEKHAWSRSTFLLFFNEFFKNGFWWNCPFSASPRLPYLGHQVPPSKQTISVLTTTIISSVYPDRGHNSSWGSNNCRTFIVCKTTPLSVYVKHHSLSPHLSSESTELSSANSFFYSVDPLVHQHPYSPSSFSLLLAQCAKLIFFICSRSFLSIQLIFCRM